MRTDLGPLSLGDIFDEAFDLYKRNFVLFSGVVAVVYVPAQIAMSALTINLNLNRLDRTPTTSAEMTTLFAAFGILMVASVIYHFLYIVHSGALSLAVAERYLERPATLGSIYRRLLPRLPTLLITWLVIDCIIGALAFVLMFVLLVVLSLMVAAAGMAGGPSDVLSVVLAIIVVGLPMLMFFALLVLFAVFSTQIVVLEGTGYMGAVQRNWNLVRGRFWRTLFASVGVALVILALRYALEGTLSLALGSFVYTWLPVSTLAHRVIEETLSTVIGLFLQPFVMVSLTLLYLDHRMRKEGFDLVLLAQAAEIPAVSEVPA